MLGLGNSLKEVFLDLHLIFFFFNGLFMAMTLLPGSTSVLSHYAKSCGSSTWEEELEFIPFAVLAKKENLFGKQVVFPSNEKKTFCLYDSVKKKFFLRKS